MREAEHHLADARTRAVSYLTVTVNAGQGRQSASHHEAGLGCAEAYYTAVEYASIRRCIGLADSRATATEPDPVVLLRAAAISAFKRAEWRLGYSRLSHHRPDIRAYTPGLDSLFHEVLLGLLRSFKDHFLHQRERLWYTGTRSPRAGIFRRRILDRKDAHDRLRDDG